MQSKLKELLDNYIAEYSDMKVRYEDLMVKFQLYEELLSYFDEANIDLANNKIGISLLLNTIYNDDIYEKEFYSLLYKLERGEYNSKNEIRSFLSMINGDYVKITKELESLKNRINRTSKVVSSARRARLSFKYNSPIEDTKYVMGDLRRIINYYESSGEISNKEAILCINDLDFYNRNVISASGKVNKKEEEYASRVYNEIPNILKAGYEVIEEPEVDISRKASLNRIVEEITNTVRYTKNDKISEYLESYEKYELDNNEYNYVIINVLNSFIEELISYYQLLLDRETYSRVGNRKEIIKDYYTELSRYLVVRDYYNKYNEIIIDEDIALTDEEEKELQDEKRMIYSTSLANPTKAKIIGDMDDVPKEYYTTVLDLITRFKKGTTVRGEVKPLGNNKKLKKIMELRTDQVRIILKHVKDNIYNIMGVFTKKDDNNIMMYQTIANRIVTDISSDIKLRKALDIAEITEKELENIVQTKGRKGTR